MAKVLGVHEIELGDGADPAEFERAAGAFVAATAPDGVAVRLFKGERGLRDGKYLMVIELDSVETWQRLFPVPDEDSAEILAFGEANPASAEAWAGFSGIEHTDVVTDYVEIAE